MAEKTVSPKPESVVAEITALNEAGATHVLLAITPGATGILLGTALKMKFTPTWIGSTPAWVDAFFSHAKLPPAVFANYNQLSGLPFWGEDLPGMKEFEAAFQKYAPEGQATVVGKPVVVGEKDRPESTADIVWAEPA